MAYHSNLSSDTTLCKMALLPLKQTKPQRGPAPKLNADEDDIIDESIYFFRANVFFRNYEIKSPADRTLIYITLYIQECLKKLERCGSRKEAENEMYTLAIQNFDIPGDPGFVLNAMYGKPSNRNEADQTKAYIQQLRHEIGSRIIEKVFDPNTDKPSKWWLCFTKRKFMNKSLSKPGYWFGDTLKTYA